MGILATIGASVADTALGKAFGLGEKAIDGFFQKKQAEIKAMNDQDRLAASVAIEEMKADIEADRVRADIIKAEQGSFFTRMVRPLFALPFVIFTFKVIVWDKVLGLGTTDKLDPNLWSVFMIIVGAYFGGRTIERSASIVSSIFKNRK